MLGSLCMCVCLRWYVGVEIVPYVCASYLIYVGELACVSLYLHVFSKQHVCQE